MPLNFSSLTFQLYRVPPGHNSFVMSFPFLPSALGLISIGGKHPQSPPEVKRSRRRFSPLRTRPEAGYSSDLPALVCTAGRRGAKLLYFCSRICTKEMFFGLPALWKAGRALDICLRKSPHNMHCSSLLETGMFGKEGGKWTRERGCHNNPVPTGNTALAFVKRRDTC